MRSYLLSRNPELFQFLIDGSEVLAIQDLQFAIAILRHLPIVYCNLPMDIKTHPVLVRQLPNLVTRCHKVINGISGNMRTVELELIAVESCIPMVVLNHIEAMIKLVSIHLTPDIDTCTLNAIKYACSAGIAQDNEHLRNLFLQRNIIWDTGKIEKPPRKKRKAGILN
jgi:hypothetical protein